MKRLFLATLLLALPATTLAADAPAFDAQARLAQVTERYQQNRAERALLGKVCESLDAAAFEMQRGAEALTEIARVQEEAGKAAEELKLLGVCTRPDLSGAGPDRLTLDPKNACEEKGWTWVEVPSGGAE